MSDYQYVFTGLSNSAAWHAARLGVLWPVTGSVAASSSERQLRALGALISLWRGRVSELANKQWIKLKDSRKVQYLRNCTPTMAAVKETNGETLGKYCNFRDICPWCYARRFVYVFDKTSNHLNPETNKHDKLVYTRSDHIDRFDSLPPVVEIKNLFAKPRNLMAKLALANSKTCNGIHWLTAVAADAIDPHKLITSCGLVAIMPKQEHFDLVPAGWTLFEYEPPVDISSIVEATSRAFHYPVGLLKGDVDVTVEILKARENLRLSDSYGCYRGA